MKGLCPNSPKGGAVYMRLTRYLTMASRNVCGWKLGRDTSRSPAENLCTIATDSANMWNIGSTITTESWWEPGRKRTSCMLFYEERVQSLFCLWVD